MDFKRPSDAVAVVPNKRQKTDIAIAGPTRTSSLLAPIMLLTGHDGEIYTAKFSPDGTCLASGGFDRLIYLWNVNGECENFSVLRGHTGSVTEVQFSSDGASLYSASTDKSIRIWDMETGQSVRRLRGHQSFVNSCHPARRGPQLLVSGSDDGTIRVWDCRKRDPIHTFQNTYQVTSVTFNDTAEQVVSAGIDNDLKVWDLRKGQNVLYKMRGHNDTVTGLRLSYDGSYVLSNSMDNTVRIWDIRPFAPELRCVKVFQGHVHNFEKNLLKCSWSPDGTKVSAGSADRFVVVWDTTTRNIIYRLPGHTGSVNETDFHPKENIILSAGSDKKIYLGEIE